MLYKGSYRYYCRTKKGKPAKRRSVTIKENVNEISVGPEVELRTQKGEEFRPKHRPAAICSDRGRSNKRKKDGFVEGRRIISPGNRPRTGLGRITRRNWVRRVCEYCNSPRPAEMIVRDSGSARAAKAEKSRL